MSSFIFFSFLPLKQTFFSFLPRQHVTLFLYLFLYLKNISLLPSLQDEQTIKDCQVYDDNF